MSNNAQILTMIGQLGNIPPNGTQVVTASLVDGAGLSVDITDVTVGYGLGYEINNSVDPRQVTFINYSDVNVAGASYRIAHDHTIQTQYPTPSGANSAALPATANTAQGFGEWYSEIAQVIAAGVPDPTEGDVEFLNSIITGSLLQVLSLAGTTTLRFEPVSINRVFKFEAKINAEVVVGDVVTLQLVRDPSGAGSGTTVIAETQAFLDAGEVGELTLQALVPVTALQIDDNDRQYSLRVSAPLAAGDITVGLGAPRGVDVIVSSIV